MTCSVRLYFTNIYNSFFYISESCCSHPPAISVSSLLFYTTTGGSSHHIDPGISCLSCRPPLPSTEAGMSASLPTPVLSISSDAVKDLEGRDALLGLWTCKFLLHGIIHILIHISTPPVFTKCKESLQDGRRLENISWRLWYREMMRDGSRNRLSQGNVNEKEEQDFVLKPHAPHTPIDLYRPPTPSESTPSLPPYVVQDANGFNGLPLSDQPPLLPQDHDHAS